jgi:hypothetical protein
MSKSTLQPPRGAATENAIRAFDHALAEHMRRPGSTWSYQSGDVRYVFRRSAGQIRVVAKPVRWPRRPGLVEYARRVQGRRPDLTIDCRAVEQRVMNALRAGADVYHQRSGRTTYAFRTHVERGLIAVASNTIQRNPVVEEYAARLRQIRVCQRPDCRKPFQAKGRKRYCSSRCASTIRSRRARR